MPASMAFDLYVVAGDGSSVSDNLKVKSFPKHPLKYSVCPGLSRSLTDCIQERPIASIIDRLHCLHDIKEFQVDAVILVCGVLSLSLLFYS